MRKSKINNNVADVENPFSVGLLGAAFGTNNLGVAALACGTIDAICHSHPDARLFLVDYAKKPATYNVLHSGGSAKAKLINIRFSKRFFLRNNIARLIVVAFCFRILPSHKWKIRLIQRNHVLRTIHEANIIGSIAGGDSFSDIYGIGRLIYITLPQILVLLLGKPLLLLPQTIGPFKSSFAKTIARYILRRADKVFARDYNSLNAVRKLTRLRSERYNFCYDLGFAMEPRIAKGRIPDWFNKIGHSSQLVGLNISGLLQIGGYTRNNMFGLKVDYQSLICTLIESFVRKHKANVILIPHVLGVEPNSESDVIACRKVYHNAHPEIQKHLFLVNEDYDQHELKALIGRCGFLLGSRMHACIAALSQGVPAVGLAYSAKFKGVFESIGLEELVIDLRLHDENSIGEMIEQIFKRLPEFRKHLEEKMPYVRASIMSLFQ